MYSEEKSGSGRYRVGSLGGILLRHGGRVEGVRRDRQRSPWHPRAVLNRRDAGSGEVVEDTVSNAASEVDRRQGRRAREPAAAAAAAAAAATSTRLGSAGDPGLQRIGSDRGARVRRAYDRRTKVGVVAPGRPAALFCDRSVERRPRLRPRRGGGARSRRRRESRVGLVRAGRVRPRRGGAGCRRRRRNGAGRRSGHRR